jgi:hypothetical protein
MSLISMQMPINQVVDARQPQALTMLSKSDARLKIS